MAVTTKLGLNLPSGSDPCDGENHIGQPMGKINDLFDAYPCTAATRPATNLYTGRLIWERDTGLLRAYDVGAVAWKTIAKKNHARGKVGLVTSTSASANATKNTEVGSYLSITYTPVALRVYVAKFSLNFRSSDQHDIGDSQIRLRLSNSGSVSVSDSQVYFMWADYTDDTGGGSVPIQGFYIWIEGSSPPATKTLGLFIYHGNSTGTFQCEAGNYNVMSIEDWGS